jgi:hypothetical protein
MPQVLDFIAQAYTAHSRPLNGARCVNFFAELEQQDARNKSPVGIWGCAGISPFTDTADGPIKALDMMNGVVYAVGNNYLWQVNADGSLANLGQHKATSPISIDNNGIQLVWVDGSTGWYWSSGTGVQQITDPNFFPSSTVTFFDGYFCFVRNGTKQFYLSPLYGITPFDPLLTASKEATPDLLLAIANSHEQLFLFGQERTEVWFDAGNPPPTFPFQRSDGAIIQRGTLAPLSIVLEDNTLFFLGDDGMFYRANNFVPERLSNHAVENAWQQYERLTDAVSLVYTTLGHKQVTITFPSAKKTWVVDLATKRWHERESWLGASEDDSIGRWRGNCVITAYNRVLIGDSASGKIGQLDYDVFTEWGDAMRGLIDGPPIHHDRKRLTMKRFELDVESGVGLPRAAPFNTLSYCLTPVTITEPTTLTSSAPIGTLPANYPNALFSVWLNLSGTDASGIRIENTGFTLVAQNDGTGTPQFTVTAKDESAATIVTATYNFSSWSNWVNVLCSIGTASQQIQMFASTIVAGSLVESELSPVSLTWSSSNAIAQGGSWQLSVV